jgi:CubicO group peptidase (beta-lactamase class C family)
LFEPLGIELGHWMEDERGHLHGMSGIGLRAEDLLALGQLLLDGGVYEGKRILPAQWVVASTRGSETSPRYGTQWWAFGDSAHCLLDQQIFAQLRASGVSDELVRAL